MARRFPKEVHEFIAANVKGTSVKDLTALVNEHFGEVLFSFDSMKSYLHNRGLKNGRPHGVEKGKPTDLYPQEVIDYICANVEGVSHYQMSVRVNEAFGTSYTRNQIKRFYAKRGLNSGLTGGVEKGHTPPNKGKKGERASGCEKTWFQKGNSPPNKLPIGTVLKKYDGYLWRKIGESSREWKQEHLLVWEAANGPMPEGCLVGFKDGNKENVALENLMLLTKAENAQLNNRKLRFSDPEKTEVGLMIARVHIAAKERSKNAGKNQEGTTCETHTQQSC